MEKDQTKTSANLGNKNNKASNQLTFNENVRVVIEPDSEENFGTLTENFLSADDYEQGESSSMHSSKKGSEESDSDSNSEDSDNSTMKCQTKCKEIKKGNSSKSSIRKTPTRKCKTKKKK